MTRKITIEHKDAYYEAEVVTIDKTFLGYEDHGIFTFDLTLRSAGTSFRRVGGYRTDGPSGADWIKAVLEVVGVRSWEELRGKLVLAVLDQNDTAVGLAHIKEDKVFILRDFARHGREE